MNIFEVVNELSIAGTALLLMALGVLWYETFSTTPSGVSEAPKSFIKTIVFLSITFVCFAELLFMCALLLTLLPILNMSLPMFIAIAWVSGVAFLLMFTLFEKRSTMYFFTHAGFLALFMVVGVLVLTYWPW